MKNTDDKLCTEIHRNIYKICLPFPGKKPGPVNVYLFVGERVTLIDTGIIRTVGILRDALLEIGLKFTDIDQVIISHGHIDHYGAAKKIVDGSRGRTKVAIHADDAMLIETGQDVSKKKAQQFLRLMGVPLLYREAMRLLRTGFKLLVENCGVDMILNDGDRIKLGDYDGTVINTPGHSKGAICIYLQEENILFAGDHILKHITPNALVMIDSHSEIPKRLSQDEYYKSLSRVEGLGQPLVYTGHGNEVDDLKEVADFYREQFKKRQDDILSELDSGSNTIYQVTKRVFPNISGLNILIQIYLAISEVYTHLQVHEKEKRVSVDLRNKRLVVQKIE